MRVHFFFKVICFLSVGFLLGCRHHHEPEFKILASQHVVRKMLPLASFSQVQIEGMLSVQLFTDSKKSYVVLKGGEDDLAHLKIKSHDGVLDVNLGKGYPHAGLVVVEIHTRYLTRLAYTGRGLITGKNIHSKGLDLMIANQDKTTLRGRMVLRHVIIKGGLTEIGDLTRGLTPLNLTISQNAKVRLSGMIPLMSLNIQDKSWFSAYWVNGATVKICAKDASYVQLAGTAEVLDVELKDSAHLNARYLRAKRTFVKTFGHSEAKISTTEHQHVLASDASNVYFYNRPESQTDFMAYDGSVLDLRDWASY